MTPSTLFHVDVFATGPLTGNGLTVFLNVEGWSTEVMQRLTQEMRQFESIFLSGISPDGAKLLVSGEVWAVSHGTLDMNPGEGG